MKPKPENKKEIGNIKRARSFSKKAVTLTLIMLCFVSTVSTIFHISPVDPALASATTLTLHQYVIYDQQYSLTAQQYASYTDAFQIHHDASQTIMDNIHSLEASYLGLVYRNVFKVSPTTSPEWPEFAAKKWILKDQNGAYVYETRFGYNFVDIGNPSCQQWIADWIYNETTKHSYNGVFCDGGFNAYVAEIWEFASNSPINPRTGTFWTDQQVRDAYVGLHNRIRAKLGTGLLDVVNGIWSGSRWQARRDPYEYIINRTDINGFMGEGWWRQFNLAAWYSEDRWKSSLDSLVELEGYFIKGNSSKMFIPACLVDYSGESHLPAGASTTQVARYGYASTLLGIQSSRDYLVMSNNPTSLQDYYRRYFSLNVGLPLGNYSVISATHVYQRSYSNALVLVNPTNTAYKVFLNGYYTNLNGSTVTGNYMMPAYTGEVLLKTAAPPNASWWNSSWRYRMNITIDHTKVSSNLTNFPVLVDLTNSTLANEIQPSGQDVVFTDINNLKLDHQIESYSNSTGHLVAWVRIPYLSSTVDTTITMYYGNPTCGNQQNATGVWDKNYLMVLHLSEKQTQCYDSTINRNNGTLYGSVTPVLGKIGGSYSFAGGYVSLPRVCSSQTQFTFSAWIYAQSGARYFISEWANNQGAFLQVSGNSEVQFYVNGIKASEPISLNQWHYVVGTYDGTTTRLWVDGGSAVSVVASAPIWPAQNTYVGDRYDHTRQFNGLIDEVKVSNIARSNSWINSEYVNQNAQIRFYTIGSQETFSA